MSSDPLIPGLHAVVLAGGESTRMGANKAEVRLDGRRLVDLSVGALEPLAGLVSVVSPVALGVAAGRVREVSECPPFGGPVAGIAAALDETYPLTAVLTVDAPRAAGALPALAAGLDRAAGAGVCHVSGDPLCALWRTAALSRALGELREVRDQPARRLLSRAFAAPVRGKNLEELARDYDSPGELEALGRVELPGRD